MKPYGTIKGKFTLKDGKDRKKSERWTWRKWLEKEFSKSPDPYEEFKNKVLGEWPPEGKDEPIGD